MRPFFSLIIPCQNSIYIKRLFDSLLKQGIDKDDIEIIVVDDNSDDKSYQDIIKEYDFNVIFADTNTAIHCPGNTRKKGMEYISGQWLYFCDHDDYFEDGALAKVKEYIEASEKLIYCLVTKVHAYDEDNQRYIQEVAHRTVWLHGKFYNVDYLIKPYQINFKEDLMTNEDAYFNCCVINALIMSKANFEYYNIPTYRWIENPDSLSHKQGYLYDNFDDYIISTTEPYWDYAVTTKNSDAINQILMSLLHCYFYYEAGSYYNGSANYKHILEATVNLFNRIIKDFQCTAIEVIECVYQYGEQYHIVYEDCKMTCGYFIPKTSFRDFIMRLILEL